MSSVSSIARLPQTFRNLQRLRDILSVITKYGFEGVVLQLGLEGYVDQARRLLRLSKVKPSQEWQRFTVEQRIRMIIEELGPTYIKFGQILATRPDLIPMSLILELRKLQDDVPAFSQSEARQVIETELGGKVEDFFASFEEKPLAAASIAQVHRATLKSGERVVLKVQRPGLARIIENDLDILRFLADLVHDNVPEARQFDPKGLVANFSQSIVKEIDFTREAFNILKFQENFRDTPWMKAPTVYTALSTARVLTMEFIDGIKASNLAAIDAAGLDRKLLATRGTEAVLKMIFVDGFFHADPHPGNIFVLPGNVFCLIDYGMMGTVDDERVDELLMFLVGLLTGDMDRVVQLFYRLELIDDRVNVRALKSEGKALLDRYGNQSLKDIDIAVFITEVFETIQRHHVALPSDLLLMAKAVATIEGIAQELYPEYDPLTEMRTYLLKIYTKRLTDPGYLFKGVYNAVDSYVYFLRKLPRELESIVSKLRKGELTLKVEDPDGRRAARAHERALNRLTLAIFYLATGIGSAILLIEPRGPHLLGMPATTLVGVLGLLLALTVAAILGLSFLRSD
jgi:ubiquinone biosynthesis protein